MTLVTISPYLLFDPGLLVSQILVDSSALLYISKVIVSPFYFGSDLYLIPRSLLPCCVCILIHWFDFIGFNILNWELILILDLPLV